MFTFHLSEIIVFLNKVILSRRRILKLLTRIIFKRFLNDLLANLREAYIFINFSHLAQKIFILSI